MPFPLEYPSIAPFYSNVDTTNAGPETSISLSKLPTERNKRLALEAVRRNFAVDDSFRVVNLVVATWENVGHYRENNTDQNTFQVMHKFKFETFSYVRTRLIINNLNLNFLFCKNKIN